LSAWRELDLAHAENLTAPGSAQLHLAIRWPESQKRAKNFYRLKKHWKLAVPRGVEPPTFGLGNRCSTARGTR
jgi:hypothetical protein